MHLKYNDVEGTTHLFPRKGGGGRGGGGSKGGKGGKGSSKAPSPSSVAKKHGASDTFVKSRGGGTFTVTGGSSGSSAYPYSEGGGKRITLGASSSFSGRQAGGGTRTTIYGTSRFGSGYPYGGYGTYVDSRPLPYYFYPVPVSHNYYGGNAYLNVYDRPGGNLTTAIVQPSYNTSSVTYRLVGDYSSVIAVFDAVVVNCSVVNSTSPFTRFEPSNTTWPVPEQIVQYYRASSFALSLDTYNNTAALLSNAPASNTSAPLQMADTPLPTSLNTTFLQCLNYTIGASIPLVVLPVKKGLTTAKILQIVFGSLFGAMLLGICVWYCCLKPRCRDRKKNKKKKLVEKLDDDTPNIRVIGSDDAKSSPPAYTDAEPSKKGLFGKGLWSKNRPVSVDERTLTEDPSGHKDSWSYASSSASSRTDLNDSTNGPDLAKLEGESSSRDNQPDSTKDKSSWLSKLHLPGRSGYRSVKHQSTSSIELPLTEARQSHEMESTKERNEIAFPSPSHSRSSSRSPSPSPTTPRFPLMHGEDKGPLH